MNAQTVGEKSSQKACAVPKLLLRRCILLLKHKNRRKMKALACYNVMSFFTCTCKKMSSVQNFKGLQGVTRMAYSPSLWLMAIGW